MTIAFNTHAEGLNTTSTASFNLPSGAFVLVVIKYDYDSVNEAVNSVTDTAGNTYSVIITENETTQYGNHIAVAYAKNTTAHATNVVTVSLAAGASLSNIIIVCYTGVDTSSPLISSSYVNSLTTNNISVTEPAVILAGYGIWSEISSGFSTNNGFTLRSFANGYDTCGIAELIVSSSTTINCTFTADVTTYSTGNGFISAFKAAADAAITLEFYQSIVFS